MESEPDALATVAFTIEGGGFRMSSRVTVPTRPLREGELLPLARGLSDVIVRETGRAVEAAGAAISCRAGCGACCRNLVAISEPEARRLVDVIAAMPEARRNAIQARFAAARDRLEQAGMWADLLAPERWSGDDYDARVAPYFAMGIACPFLEAESCSIYEERPITCREFLVTSPPEFCARVGSEGVERVRLPLLVFNAMARLQVATDGPLMERWVPLIAAPDWVAAHPDEPSARPGVELLRDLLGHLGEQRPDAE